MSSTNQTNQEAEMDNQILATIRHFAERHSACGISEPIKSAIADDDEMANDDAREWRNMDEAAPDWAELVEDINDGNNHDVSSVYMWRVSSDETGLDHNIYIYSYNNNAWGHCDVLYGPDESTPASIEEWLQNWDELPEQWLKDYAGVEDDE